MKLRVMIAATAAVIAIGLVPSAQLLAQGNSTQSGASAGQSGSGGQVRNSENASSRGPAASGQSIGGRAENGGKSSAGTETRSGSVTSIQAGSRVNGRSQTRVGVSSGGREDIILQRRRAHGAIVYNDEPSRQIIVKNRRPHRYVMYSDEPRYRSMIRERHPGVAVTERSVTRSNVGGDINVRSGVRSHEAGAGGAIRINQGRSSVSGAPQSGGQTGASANQTGGNVKGQAGSSTTGQGTR